LLEDPAGIALDVAGGKMYWTDFGTDRIHRANLDGSGVEGLLSGLGGSGGIIPEANGPRYIALDIGGGKVYWTRYNNNVTSINRANLDGTGAQSLVGLLGSIGGLALYPASGKMYWTDYGADKICRANLDGSGVEDLVTTGLEMLQGIALDTVGGKMYWIDNGTDKIQRANLNGSGVEDLVTGLSYPRSIALDVAGGKMYWTDAGTYKIQRANLDGSGVEDLVTTGLDRPGSIALDATGGKMYWMSSGVDKIQRANLDGTGVFDVIESRSFTGVFDGNGHTISNFTYDGDGLDYVGLFGRIDDINAEVRDLGLINPNINSGTANHVGALAGQLRLGRINGCYAEGGSVTGTDYIGGLVGDIKATLFLRHGYISDCYSTADVTGDDYVGGLIGKNYLRAIYYSYSTGSVTGDNYVGGLVGYNESAEVSESYSRGSVTGYKYVGGLIGDNYNGDVSRCYSTGVVTGDISVGGLVGYDESSFGDYIGCFWDSDVNPGLNGIGNMTDPNVTGLPTAEMQTVSTFTDAGWDFIGESENGPSDDWAEPSSGGYPILWHQLDEGDLPALPVFSGGTGDINDPYLISTALQLNTIGHNGRLMESCFKLTDDVDLDGMVFFPIGNRGYPLRGIFDGDGHTISNFVHDSNGLIYVGLFRCVDGPNGEVRDIGLIDASINAGHGFYVGSLVGFLSSGKIVGCYVEGGSVTGLSGSAGGLVGMSFYGNISDCHSASNVTSMGYWVGGLAGLSFRSRISGCYSTGNVTGDDDAGGLVGRFEEDNISNCYSTANVTGVDNVGGLAGYNITAFQITTISDSYSSGIVSGDERVGGFLGYNRDLREPSIYTACFWDSDVNPDVNGIGNMDEPNVVGLPTVLMQTESTFTGAGWDFVGETVNGTEDIWDICEGTNYPKLAWSIPAGDFMCPDGVDMIDFAVLGDAWMSDPNMGNWDARCDISEPADEVIDGLDLGVFVGNWLEGL
jgi:hypothetical protein